MARDRLSALEGAVRRTRQMDGAAGARPLRGHPRRRHLGRRPRPPRRRPRRRLDRRRLPAATARPARARPPPPPRPRRRGPRPRPPAPDRLRVLNGFVPAERAEHVQNRTVAPDRATRRRLAWPSAGRAAAIASASAGSQSRAIDGPLPDSQPHQRRPPGRRRGRRATAGRRRTARPGAAGPPSPHRSASTSPATSAATSSAVRPTLNTASANGDRRRRGVPRDLCVDVACGGIHTTITGSRASGTDTTRPAAVATTPP